jgi:shikimate kinase
MQRTDRVFLIGPMAAGKSAIGRQLAQLLGYEFYDSDHVIERRCGADIAWIFDVEGEAGFRRREAAVIDELTTCQNSVLATGGGAILLAENREFLRNRGLVIYLQASLDTLLLRTEKDKKRPLLQSGDKRQVLERMLTLRDPLYLETAHICVSTDSHNMQTTLREIQLQLEGRL